MKVAIYARVSTEAQTIDNQLLALEKWAEQRGWEIVERYMEAESAWTANKQVELARLRRDAQHANFEAIVVWALDRLTREGPAAILNLVNALKHYGVKVISYQEPWTDGPAEMVDLLYSITGWVARMESQRRSERTKAGIERRKAKGLPHGRPAGSKDSYRRKRTKKGQKKGW